MKRLSDENGENAGWRNVGRFFLSMIPAALGGAAIMWITAAFGWIDLTREVRMQRRTMESVGVKTAPIAPIKLVAHDDTCLKIESSYIDGNRLQFYTRNTCHRWLSLPNYAHRSEAHDGTVIGSERWAFNGDKAIGPNERREQASTLDKDNRIETIKLWVIDGQ